MARIITWNCRGLLGKSAEFSNFMLDFDIICLQETWLKGRDITEFGGYEVLRRDRALEVGGGTAIICRSALDPFSIDLHFIDSSIFEYVSCIVNRIKINNKPLLIISIYRPPSVSAGVKRWESLIYNIERLTNDYAILLCGDLNVQHTAWGSSRPNPAGVCLSNFISKSTLIYLNDGSGTRISANRDHTSAPDLTITSSNMAEFCSWNVLEDPMGSDHLPIYIDLREKHIDNEGGKVERPKLILTCFDKELFIKLITESFSGVSVSDSNGAELYDLWYNKVILCCLKAGARKRDISGNILSFNSKKDRIVNSSKKPVGKCLKKINKPWWDEECERKGEGKEKGLLASN